MVLLDRFHPPIVDDGLLKEASIVRQGNHSYLRRSRPNERGIIVYVDTAHTEPCETGGYWTSVEGSCREIAEGLDGHLQYTLRDEGALGLLGERRQEVDDSTCYQRGLFLLMPGDQIKVVFHAAGTVEGKVSCDTTLKRLNFELTRDEVDPDYRYEQPDYQFEADMRRSEPSPYAYYDHL